jgi:hypothetical protein
VIVGEICIIDISLNNETAEEAGINECTQHYWPNHDVYIEWREYVLWGGWGAGISGIHDVVC